MSETPEHGRATAGPYTLVIPPNGRATLYEADGAGVDHEVPYGVNQLDALVQFAGEVIRLRAMIESTAEDLLAALRTIGAPDEIDLTRMSDPAIRGWAYAAANVARDAIEKMEPMAGVAEQSGTGAPETSVRCGAPAATSSAT